MTSTFHLVPGDPLQPPRDTSTPPVHLETDRGEPLELEILEEDPSRPFKTRWGREWADPEKREARLEARRDARGKAVAQGVELPAQLVKRRHWPERSRAGASLSALLWKLGRRGRLVLDAYMAKPGSSDSELGDLVGRGAGWVRKLKNTGTWRMAGELLVDMARPGAKLSIENAIITDAQLKLDQVETGAAGALVKTRDQAAAILGIDIKPPEKTEHSHTGELSMVHRMAQEHPREALEAFQETGEWDEALYGLPPWRRLNSS